MKRFLLIPLLLIILLIPMLASCKEVIVAPGAEPSSVVPTVNNTYDLGRTTKVWRVAYVNSIDNANQASGNVSLTGGGTAVVVTHGLSGTPTQVFLTFIDGIPGTAASSTAGNPVQWNTANGTNFTITAATTTNATASINWLALIAGE